jgi:hypothetical protein
LCVSRNWQALCQNGGQAKKTNFFQSTKKEYRKLVFHSGCRKQHSTEHSERPNPKSGRKQLITKNQEKYCELEKQNTAQRHRLRAIPND